MKVVYHIRIAQRLDKNQFIIVRPPGACRDNRVLRSPFANRRRQLRLHSVPAVTIGKLGLVQNFKEDALRIPCGIMPRQRSPEVGELLHKTVVFR